MSASGRPSHLLLFDEALADDLVDGRFYEGGGDNLAIAIAVTV